MILIVFFELLLSRSTISGSNHLWCSLYSFWQTNNFGIDVDSETELNIQFSLDNWDFLDKQCFPFGHLARHCFTSRICWELFWTCSESFCVWSKGNIYPEGIFCNMAKWMKNYGCHANLKCLSKLFLFGNLNIVYNMNSNFECVMLAGWLPIQGGMLKGNWDGTEK